MDIVTKGTMLLIGLSLTPAIKCRAATEGTGKICFLIGSSLANCMNMQVTPVIDKLCEFRVLVIWGHMGIAMRGGLRVHSFPGQLCVRLHMVCQTPRDQQNTRRIQEKSVLVGNSLRIHRIQPALYIYQQY